MSKDIWHFPSEAPAYCFLCAFYDQTQGLSVGHYNPVKKQFCSGDRRFNHDEIKTYCEIYDLLALEAEMERTRSALEIAVDALKLMYQGNGDPQDIMRYIDNRWTPVRRLCKQTLEQITAQGQKD